MKRSALLGSTSRLPFYRPMIIGSLASWLAASCISAEEPANPGTLGKSSSTVGGGSGVGNSQGGAIAGDTGGSPTTGGAIVGSTGGSAIVGNAGTPAGTTGGAPADATGGQGTDATGGSAGDGGASSAAPPPNGNLGVYIDTQNNGGAITGDQALHVRVEIVNTSSTPQDLASVTLRYWYVDDGWGSTPLTMEADYVSIGYSTQGTVKFEGSYAVAPVQDGADHYLEFSLTGTLAAVNDSKTNDIFHVQLRIHPTNNSGTVDVSNDYSVMTSTGYDDKITLYAAGALIWGTEPGGSSPISGSGGASGVGGSTATNGGSTSPDSMSTGGDASTGGDVSAGGDTSTGGDASTGGDVSAGGDTSTGGDSSLGGVSGLGGDSSLAGSFSVDAG